MFEVEHVIKVENEVGEPAVGRRGAGPILLTSGRIRRSTA